MKIQDKDYDKRPQRINRETLYLTKRELVMKIILIQGGLQK